MATLTPPPTAPNPNDPKTFEANADAHLAWLALNVSEMNSFQAALTAIAAGTAFAIPYTFSTTTTDSDPGPGFLRLDNAIQNTATTIRADLIGSDGSNWTGILDTFDDSTSAVTGQIMLVKLGDATKWLAFNVTALASPAGYKNITVTNVASSAASPFVDTDTIALKFTRTGDKGDTGNAGANGANGTNGTNGADGLGVPGQNVTATTSTALTSTATILQITPNEYGVYVALPDATTCSVGLVHIIDNKGVYEIRVLNSSGTLLGFVPAGVVSHVSLGVKTTSAGVWTIENAARSGVVTQKTLTIWYVHAVVDIGNNREIILYGNTVNANIYGIVYNATTNAYSSPTLIRSASLVAGNVVAGKVADDKVLVVSCAYSTTAFEAVVISINSLTDVITPNTAATATLSANINVFADGCGLIQVGTSFITSYTVANPAAQIREITVSGTTPTISAATVLDGTAGGLIIAGDATHVIAVSTATTHLYTKPYAIGGLAAGTGTDTAITSGGVATHLGAMSTGRFFIGHKYATSSYYGAILTLSGTTTAISSVTLGSGGLIDAIIVSSTKVLAISSDGAANILTDSAGTASAGTQIAIAAASCLYVTGTDVVVQCGTTTYEMKLIDCSGASPVVKKIMAQTYLSNVDIPVFNAANSMLSKSQDALYSTEYARTITRSSATINFAACAKKDVFSKDVYDSLNYSANTAYRGTSDRSRWLTDSSTIMTKVECAA